MINIDDGQTFPLKINRSAFQTEENLQTEESTEEEVETVQVEVVDKMISYTWEIEDTSSEEE